MEIPGEILHKADHPRGHLIMFDHIAGYLETI